MTNTPPSPVDRSRPVLVTGANGFIASWIVAQLLADGWRVRGTVRDPAKAVHLRALSDAAERLELVSADLLDADSLRRAAEGCSAMRLMRSGFPP